MKISMESKCLLTAFLTCAASAVFGHEPARPGNGPRERLPLDGGWKFYLGNPWGDGLKLDKAGENRGPAQPDFSDSEWRTVDLPHDWAVELPFDATADCNHGFKPVGPGFPQNDTGWYRQKIVLPGADKGKRFWLEFDGVYRDCDVFVNGYFVGHHDDGYDSFYEDITDVASLGGTNVIAVKVDASKFEGWFYEGAGIYRHVWLIKTGPLAITPDGIFVYSEFKNNVPQGAARIKVEVSLRNRGTNSAKATASCTVISPEGEIVAQFDKAGEVTGTLPETVRLNGRVAAPELWSPESPKLYKLVTTVKCGGKTVDSETTDFGIRTVAFDPDNGFLLNGRHYEVKGTCNHQDAAGVGAAVPDALQYFRVKKLKEMGCNAYRTSHNAPTPELLDACDRLGMLVLDENRLFGSDAANLERLRGQIARDRNHPSVFAWSLANEEWDAQDSARGAAIIETMQAAAHAADPTRKCTAAVNSGTYGNAGFFAVLDVKGFNYHFESMDAYHARFPKADILGTEQASSIGTRGIYTNDASRGYVSAYDDHNPRWGQSAEEWWSYFGPRPWAAGGFDWTGFDYRGEPTPYQWPCISSHFGILDTCGFPKDNFWYYQSWWTDKPVLHLLPHWNWPGREGQEIDVRALSNCQEVELFQDGQSLGRRQMKVNSEVKWTVKYRPGVLSAKGYNDGKAAAETKIETTGAPASIQLVPDRLAIDAGGQDVSVVTVAVLDAQGRVVPVASNLIHFQLTGAGKILGVGNGDPTCHEPDRLVEEPRIRVVSGNSGWHYKKMARVENPKLPELQPGFDDSAWEKADPQSAEGPLNEHEQAIFRTTIQMSESDLAVEAIHLKINCIDDRGWIYVNGRRAGESHDYKTPAVVDIEPFLKVGENSISIAVINDGGPGGVNHGVMLEFVQTPPPLKWQRSVFNGLAQVLVQSSATQGPIVLTATGDNLTPASVSIESLNPAARNFVSSSSH